MGNGQAMSDPMTLAGIEPADVEDSDPPLDPAPHRLIAGLSFLCYPFLTGSCQSRVPKKGAITMNKYGMSYSEIDTIQTMDPALAAHNIALAYIQNAADPTSISEGEDVIVNDVLSMAEQYVQAYNYAFNLVTHKNELVKLAENAE